MPSQAVGVVIDSPLLAYKDASNAPGPIDGATPTAPTVVCPGGQSGKTVVPFAATVMIS